MKITILDGAVENPGDLSWDALAALGDLTVYDLRLHRAGGDSPPHRRRADYPHQ